jgi:hypothetical protein
MSWCLPCQLSPPVKKEWCQLSCGIPHSLFHTLIPVEDRAQTDGANSLTGRIAQRNLGRKRIDVNRRGLARRGESKAAQVVAPDRTGRVLPRNRSASVPAPPSHPRQKSALSRDVRRIWEPGKCDSRTVDAPGVNSFPVVRMPRLAILGPGHYRRLHAFRHHQDPISPEARE